MLSPSEKIDFENWTKTNPVPGWNFALSTNPFGGEYLYLGTRLAEAAYQKGKADGFWEAAKSSPVYSTMGGPIGANLPVVNSAPQTGSIGASVTTTIADYSNARGIMNSSTGNPISTSSIKPELRAKRVSTW